MAKDREFESEFLSFFLTHNHFLCIKLSHEDLYLAVRYTFYKTFKVKNSQWEITNTDGC